MILETTIILLLSLLAIASAIITITHKEAVKSAIALVFHFFMLAGIYITLSAQFLAIMQIIVYTGAIMVLVLFVIMLLNASADTAPLQHLHKANAWSGGRTSPRLLFAITIAAAMLILILCFIAFTLKESANMPGIINNANGNVQAIGKELYTNFLFPLEIIGILLLSAIIGAVMLAKKNIN